MPSPADTWRVRDADVARFTEGDCHILALTLNKLHGFKTCAFAGDDGGPVDHAFVELPDGRVLDVQGVTTPAVMCRRWGWEAYQPFDFYEWCWTQPIFGDYSRKRARIIAGRLVAHYGL